MLQREERIGVGLFSLIKVCFTLGLLVNVQGKRYLRNSYRSAKERISGYDFRVKKFSISQCYFSESDHMRIGSLKRQASVILFQDNKNYFKKQQEDPAKLKQKKGIKFGADRESFVIT